MIIGRIRGYLGNTTLPLIEALCRLGEPFVDAAIDTDTGLIVPLDPALGKNLIPYGSTHLVKVVNTLNASGFYAHDVEAFARAVSNYARKN